MKKIISVIFASILFAACGGGGGGDSFVGAGNIQLRIGPDKIDTGDRTLVELKFDNTHPDGVTIKVRYPDGLQYVADTSFLTIDGKDIDIGPDFELEGDVDGTTFLIFIINDDDLKDNRGEITFELQGISATDEDSVIEVDIDVLNPFFSADSAEFDAEDEKDITVL